MGRKVAQNREKEREKANKKLFTFLHCLNYCYQRKKDKIRIAVRKRKGDDKEVLRYKKKKER